jgi:branched-chain amino acid transport system permease protein
LYDISIVVNIFLMLFIGGRGSYAGPLIGAALLTFAPEVLSGFEKAQNLIFFILLLVLLLLWPCGLFGRSQDSGSMADMLPLWLRRRLPSR